MNELEWTTLFAGFKDECKRKDLEALIKILPLSLISAFVGWSLYYVVYLIVR